MHRCSVCAKTCACQGDENPVVRIMEMPGCTHCISACALHGIPKTEVCMLCVAEALAPSGARVVRDDPSPEEMARRARDLPGGW